MGEDDPAAVGCCLPLTVPTVNEIVAGLLACFGGMHHAVTVIGMDRRARPAGRQIAGGVTLPVLALAANLMDFDAAMTLMSRAERRARLDGLQLLRIANQHHLGPGICGMGQHTLQLPRADHARLVDDKHIAAGKHVAPILPPVFHAGNGAGRNARSAFQILGGDTGQGNATDLVACRFPCLSRHAKHGALSRPGITDDNAKVASVRDMRQRVGLLVGQDKTALLGTRQCYPSVGFIDFMAFAARHHRGCTMEPLFGFDHVAGREPILAASVVPELDQIGRSSALKDNPMPSSCTKRKDGGTRMLSGRGLIPKP
jgi:hypothetical protein